MMHVACCVLHAVWCNVELHVGKSLSAGSCRGHATERSQRNNNRRPLRHLVVCATANRYCKPPTGPSVRALSEYALLDRHACVRLR